MEIAEANAILNAFAGWKPGQKCSCTDWLYQGGGEGICANCGQIIQLIMDSEPPSMLPHDIPPTDFFADTTDARDTVRLLKDEFKQKQSIRVVSHGAGDFSVDILFDEGWRWMTTKCIEHHAIAFALAAALKARKE